MLRRPTTDEAEALALQALAFLASEPERIEPFLSTTGLNPAFMARFMLGAASTGRIAVR